ncbi:MAG: hypothetical protein AABX48_02260 [Nanoarchaeota archaeon]
MYSKKYTDRNEVNGIMHATRKIIQRGMGDLIEADHYKRDVDNAYTEQFMAKLNDPDVVVYSTKVETKNIQKVFIFGDKKEVERLEAMAQEFKFVPEQKP